VSTPHRPGTAARWQRLLPAAWAGLLICVAAIAAPSAFAVLPRADAGRFVARVFAQEAWVSLALAALLLAATFARGARRAVAADRALLCVALLATLLGYFAIQPLLPAARQGSAVFSFAQLHLFSTVMYALKALAVIAVAWRACAAAEGANAGVSPGPSS